MWSSFGQPLVKAIATMKEGVASLSAEDRDGILGEGARDLYPILRAQ